jgi:hypothetical protein
MKTFMRVMSAAAALAACAGLANAQASIWQFNSGLTAASGPGVMTARSGQTFAVGSASSFGLPLINGADSGVLQSDPIGGGPGGFNIAHGTAGNGGGAYGNQYTLIWDILYPEISPNFSSLYNTNQNNANDGDLFVDGAGRIGISGVYAGTILPNTWHRVAVTVDTTTSTITKYIDGVQVGTNAAGGVDGRWALYTTNQSPTDWFILFGDNTVSPVEIALSYTSSFLFEDRVWTAGEIAAKGGPDADGIEPPAGPVPPGVSGTVSPCSPAGATAVITATPVSGLNPASTSYTVSADLSSIGLTTVALNDAGTNGDVTANDGIFGGSFTIPALAPATYALTLNVTDNLARTGSGAANLVIFANDPTSGTFASQWDFNSAPTASPFIDSSFGQGTIEFWDGVTPGGTESITQFGTTASFGIPAINGEVAGVMKFPALFSGEGFRVNSLAPGNGGGDFINQYTIAFDILFPSNQTVPPVRFPFIETNNTNSNGGDFWANFSDFSFSFQGDGSQTELRTSANAFQLDTWHRIVFVNDTARCNGNGKVYVDGVQVYSGPIPDSTDVKYSLYSTTDGAPDPDTEAYFFVFSDVEGRTSDAYVNSFFFVDRTLSDAELVALGGPSAAGIFTGTGPSCEYDFNQDENVDLLDAQQMAQVFVGLLLPESNWLDGDLNGDENADLTDAQLLAAFVVTGNCGL